MKPVREFGQNGRKGTRVLVMEAMMVNGLGRARDVLDRDNGQRSD